MQWSDVITLVSVEEPGDGRTNGHGFTNDAKETKKTVYANKKSVGFNEYFKAKQAGYTEQMKIDIYKVEYTGQPLAEYKGKRYKVLKTYEPPDKPDEIELTLSDLSEKGGGK
jgi:hypothetical protein